MRQFQVPQFIEVEDKIFGPLTLKQFFYILGAGAAIFLLYVFLPPPLVILFGAPFVAFFGALAFYPINGQPFVKYLENAFKHYTNARLYVWRKEEKMPSFTPQSQISNPSAPKMPKLTENKLKDIAWSLDVQGKKNII